MFTSLATLSRKNFRSSLDTGFLVTYTTNRLC